MSLRYSGENYLKSIFLLHQEQTVVRSVDVADRLGFTKASVSRMLKNLSQEGFVTVTDNNVCLTEKGFVAASGIYDRFSAILDFLANFLEVPVDIAARDAGGMEHIISEETLSALQKLMVKKGTGEPSGQISDTAFD